MQVAEKLWLKAGDLPSEYVEFCLCRDVFHCLPSELDEEPWSNIQIALAMLAAEERTK